jgi:hypothetical protein
VIDLRGQRAVVSGASRGIGAATVRLLARAGADVVVGYRSRSDDAEAVAEDARAAGVRAVTCGADLSTPDGCDALVVASIEAFGGVDVMVINHGIWPAEAVAVATMDDARWGAPCARTSTRCSGCRARRRGRSARAGGSSRVEHRRAARRGAARRLRGHEGGDDLVREVARRRARAVRA